MPIVRASRLVTCRSRVSGTVLVATATTTWTIAIRATTRPAAVSTIPTPSVVISTTAASAPAAAISTTVP